MKTGETLQSALFSSTMASLIRRRLLCTSLEAGRRRAVKEVTKANFAEAVEEFKEDLAGSDFVAVSLQKTGSFSAGWHRELPFDTNDTAYLKAKYAAERFQVLQFAACPFSLRASKLTAHPYNFVLFPRDELKMGMPSYSFSVQTSHLTYLAQEGFDFNACIYDGISYLSKAQESAAKVRIGNPTAGNYVVDSKVTHTVADTLFMERTKSRVKHWRNACKSGSRKDDALLSSLRKLVMGTELYGARPCMNIDVCSERQIQLSLEMLKEFSDELVPVIFPAKSGGTQSVRVVLTSSKEDKDLFERELQNTEEEQNKRVRGFREVIDLISASQKPVVSHNSLNDFTFIYSKFLSPLPANIEEFTGSLSLVFPHILDVKHLMKNIGPLRKVTNIPAAISYLNNHYFAPIDLETLPEENEGKSHRHNVVKLSYLYAKLCTILKIPENAKPFNNHLLAPALKEYTTISNLFSEIGQESINKDIGIWRSNMRKISCNHLVFLWGFRSGLTAGMLKSMLQKSHDVFTEDFDVRLVDKSCAITVFWQPGSSETFLDVVSNEDICGSLREMVSEGLRATSYQTYKRVCKLGLWEADLADSLDKALEHPDYSMEADSTTNHREILWSTDSMIKFDDL